MSGTCFAAGCIRQVEGWPPACVTHWFALPPQMREVIRRNARPTNDPQPAAYRAAVLAAIGWLDSRKAERAAAADDAAALTRRITGERDE